jgi:hypothetical protein
MRPLIVILFSLSLLEEAICASLRTQVNVLYVDGFTGDDPIRNLEGDPLPIGSAVQLGFFAGIPLDADPAAFGPAEWASFTPLAGDGSRNPDLSLRIGDGLGVPAGLISTTLIFDTDLHSGIPEAPDAGLLAALRFFDDASVHGSSYYNTVSAPGWFIQPAANPLPIPSTLNMEDDARAPIMWESGDAGFATTLPISGLGQVPEPAPGLLILAGLAVVARRNRYYD